MHWLYEKQEARNWLHAYAERASQGEEADELLRNMNSSNCKAEWYSEPRCYRIISADNSEATFKITGVICSLTLPPVTRPLRNKSPKHVRYLRQFVRLTGFGTESFDEQELKVAEVHDLFRSALGHGSTIQSAPAQYEGQFAVDIHARYLTERKTVPGLAHIPFTPDVDPRHILEDARDVHFIRTEDNVVQYSSKKENAAGLSSYAPFDPKNFREGDVAEATVTFIAYPCGDKDFRIVTTLRALTLVSSQFREDADAKRRKHEDSLRRPPSPPEQRPEPQPSRTLKRKYITYSEDTTEDGDVPMAHSSFDKSF